MAGWERISKSKATLESLDSSVLFGFEVRTLRDPKVIANFKSRTLGRIRHESDSGGAHRSRIRGRSCRTRYRRSAGYRQRSQPRAGAQLRGRGIRYVRIGWRAGTLELQH